MTLKFWKNKICYDSCGASREKFKNGKNKGFWSLEEVKNMELEVILILILLIVVAIKK